jgi:methylated-DNA-[protein]-cysteine S-methyltransferase
MIETSTLTTLIGHITLEADDQALLSVTIADGATSKPDILTPTHPILAAAHQQLAEYFDGARTSFDIPLNPQGTAFQKAIWSALQTIPYGGSTSYQSLGESAGVGKAPRAVGGAVGANPLPIVIPCHRVLASNQKITGYSGGAGIPTKKMLLELEGISYR